MRRHLALIASGLLAGFFGLWAALIIGSNVTPLSNSRALLALAPIPLVLSVRCAYHFASANESRLSAFVIGAGVAVANAFVCAFGSWVYIQFAGRHLRPGEYHYGGYLWSILLVPLSFLLSSLASAPVMGAAFLWLRSRADSWHTSSHRRSA